jgi:hypothetical protein
MLEPQKQVRGIAVLIVAILLLGATLPIIQADELDYITGFDKGPSFANVVPMKKVTFVNFDKENLLDDYAYLAAVPTAVFKEQKGDRLFSQPLLFYQEEFEDDDIKYKILDASSGIEYFMEDWMGYIQQNKLDQMTLINVDETKVSEWGANEHIMIDSESPYEIANMLALQDWSYSDNAVVAVIEPEFEVPDMEFEGSVKGTIPSGYKTDKIEFKMDKPTIGVGGKYESFEINEPYKYVIADMYWENVAVDLDLQLYDDQLGMADADSKWNIFYGPGETASSYVYNYGIWEVGVTYMPTQSLPDDEGIMETNFDTVEEDTSLLARMGLKDSNKQDVNILLYPGIEVDIDDATPYGCRNIEFTLKWNNPGVSLGFVVLDPTGAETASAPSNEEIVEGLEEGITEHTIKLDKLGETGEDEKYRICVFSLDDVTRPVDFTVEYSWQQNMSRLEGDCLASATEGAVLASMLNAPLLYVSTDNIPESTKDILYKLGVEKIHLVNLGGHLSKDVKNEIKDITETKVFTEYVDVYDAIRDLTDSIDVIFSTVDPWTTYQSKGQIPDEEYYGARFIGPAAYIAAHHGAPVLIVDNHPKLSQAVVWHTVFWQETANAGARPHLPSVACMVLTGRSVIEFLESIGYDLPTDKDELATMITVADHFDIGITWDRTFTGRLIPGRFCYSPADIAYWMARDVFYPGLIFENPALQGPVTLENGSKSKVTPYIGKFFKPLGTDLRIIRQSKDEEYVYPLLHTYNVYMYNFNKDASKHWGGYYSTAQGITPYVDPSTSPDARIDDGAVEGKVGAYVPDLHETVVAPFYATQAGYSNCFSTNFDITMENLNKGVIMWMESCHGGNGGYGSLGFWNPESPYVADEEYNPWRAYERPFLSIGNIKEFIKYLPEILGKEDNALIKTLCNLASLVALPLDLLTVDWGSTEDPDTALYNPDIKFFMLTDAFHTDFHIKENGLKSLIPIIGRKYRAHGDGIVINPSLAGENVLVKYNGIDFDEKLGNLHSMGMNAVSCLIAHTYMHAALLRHGTPYQILDPWATSWYSGIWLHSIPRQLALGYTIGQAYEQGMAEVGIQYLVDQWWWDLNENVCFYGDPDLRVWTPKTDWDHEHKNHWEKEETRPLSYDAKINLDGHTPYGAVKYPHEKEPQLFFLPTWLIIVIALILILILALAGISRKKK